jgi:predicted GNAT family acetyltransferase
LDQDNIGVLNNFPRLIYGRLDMGFSLSRYQDAGDFLSAAGEFLYTHESVNNLMLGICERLVRNPEAYENPFFAAVMDENSNFRLCAVMTPPHNLILAGDEDFSEALPVLVKYLRKEGLSIPGVIGPVELSGAFAEEWEVNTGQSNEVAMYQRIYELRSVWMPKLPPGHFRVARLSDAPTIAAWFQAFEEEALAEIHDLDLMLAKHFVDGGKAFIWERDEQLVSMALKTRPLSHSITVSGVYTPPEHRRQGYATALVARLSQHLLDAGYQFINLFTDLQNRTSNAIYQKIGYRPVCDFRMYKFKVSIEK